MAIKTKKAESIVDIATNDKNFSTLVQALQAGDLVDTLKGKGPFTVFAPTNDAFERLPEGTLEDVMKPANKAKLQDILKHHVVQGRQMSSRVAEQNKISPMAGSDLKVQAKGDRVRIGDATIRQADLEAENGVVHVIDRVLL
ncbi:MAG: fasciclin domain-containing protein [Salinibacter sp.]